MKITLNGRRLGDCDNSAELGRRLDGVDPTDDQSVADREDDRAHEQPDQPMKDEATDRADEDHGNGDTRCRAPSGSASRAASLNETMQAPDGEQDDGHLAVARGDEVEDRRTEDQKRR